MGTKNGGRWKKKEGSYFPLALLLVFICKPTRRYGGAGPHHDCTGRLWREIREETAAERQPCGSLTANTVASTIRSTEAMSELHSVYPFVS